MGREGTTKELEALRRRIDYWRLTRARRGPMPDALWAGAAEAAKKLGVSRVASVLKVGHAGLRSRAGEELTVETFPDAKGGGFVEVSGAQLLASPLAISTAATVIEYSGRDGSRMTVTVPSGSGVDVSALVVALRGS